MKGTPMTVDTAFTPDPAGIAKYLGLNPDDPRSHAALAVCQRYKLDPILKHVIVLPKGGVYLTRDGLLHVAHMSGQLDGIVLEDQGETPKEWWAVVAVYRKDMKYPFKFRGRYSKTNSNKQYGPEMALKVAESLCLRRAFDVSGLAVEEELHAAPQPPTPPKVEHVNTDTGEISQAITREQITVLATLIKQAGMSPDDAHTYAEGIIGHQLDSATDLTHDEAEQVIASLEQLQTEGD